MKQRIALVGPNPWIERAGEGGLGPLFEGWASLLGQSFEVRLISITGNSAIWREPGETFVRQSLSNADDLHDVAMWADFTSLHQHARLARELHNASVLMHNPPVAPSGISDGWPAGFGTEPVFRFPTAVGAVSKWLAHDLASVTQRSVSVVHPFVHSAFRSVDVARKGRVITFAGRLIKRKGIEDLVEAVRLGHVTDPVLVTDWAPPSADAAEAQRLRSLVASTAGMELIEPPSSRDEMALLLASSSAVVVPSYDEPFGMISVEAQVAGTKVVLYDSGGLPSTAGEGATLVPAGDLAAMGSALKEAVERPFIVETERTRMASRFSVATSAAALVELCRSGSSSAQAVA